jgi:hypothetical protein
VQSRLVIKLHRRHRQRSRVAWLGSNRRHPRNDCGHSCGCETAG